jgi:16S rRNA (guanine527-N7)-methyltransferase
LDEALSALRLRATSEVRSRLLAYLALLLKWNRVYNLTAVRAPDDMLRLHLLDCLTVLPALDRHLADANEARIMDVGSGAGLPGAVLAIMRSGWTVHCVDAIAKKAAFVQQVSWELSLPNLKSQHSRVEELEVAGHDVLISRAFSSLSDFVRPTVRQLSATGAWVAMKGRVPHEEIETLPIEVEMFHVEQLHVPGVAAQRCLVWMRRAAGGSG